MMQSLLRGYFELLSAGLDKRLQTNTGKSIHDAVDPGLSWELLCGTFTTKMLLNDE